MRSGNSWILAALALLPVSACGMIGGRGDDRPAMLASSPTDAGYDALPDAPLAPDASGYFLPSPAESESSGEERVVLGDPYTIDGVTYVPAAAPSLDEVGYAALLPAQAGHITAYGGVYAPDAIVAAHRTLPLRSYVEVTSIATGRTILVRVIDRGPMLNDRIIALSPGAARQLGVIGDGVSDGMTGVRVRKVRAIEQDRRILRSGGQVAERLETPIGLRTALAAKLPAKPRPPSNAVAMTSVAPAASPVVRAALPDAPAVMAAPLVADTQVVDSVEPAPEARLVRPVRISQPVKPAAALQTNPKPGPARRAPARPVATPAMSANHGAYVVQVAALSSRARADALARSVGGYVMPAGALFRVRAGPFATDASARAALGRIRGKGYAEARVMANDAR